MYYKVQIYRVRDKEIQKSLHEDFCLMQESKNCFYRTPLVFTKFSTGTRPRKCMTGLS